MHKKNNRKSFISAFISNTYSCDTMEHNTVKRESEVCKPTLITILHLSTQKCSK